MKPKVKDYLAALEKYHGNVTLAAKSLNVAPTTVYDNIKRSKQLQEALPRIRNTRDDAVEAVFMNKVMQGEIAPLLFYMKTQMRHRGYQETLKVEHTVEGFINAFHALSTAEQTIAIERLEKGEQGKLNN